MTKLEKLLTELELLEKNRRENGFLKSKDKKLYINSIALALAREAIDRCNEILEEV